MLLNQNNRLIEAKKRCRAEETAELGGNSQQIHHLLWHPQVVGRYCFNIAFNSQQY